MASNIKRPVRPAAGSVSTALLACFTELLICGRCFRQDVHKPVRQVLSGRHKPLALCHECSSELYEHRVAAVLKLN